MKTSRRPMIALVITFSLIFLIFYNVGNSPGLSGLQQSDNQIPKIVHQIWDSDQIPEALSHMVGRWQHVLPDYQHWLWTIPDQHFFIQTCYPQYYNLFLNYPRKINRIDAVRYFILHKYGGWYFDLDTEILKHLNPFSSHDCVLSQEPKIQAKLRWNRTHLACNAAMGSKPGHQFFQTVIENLHLYKNLGVEYSTGPLMLTTIFDAYNQNSSSENSEVILADPDHFMPRLGPRSLQLVKNTCKSADNADSLCAPYLKDDFRNEPRAESFLDHIWAHYWKTEEERKSVDVFQIVPGIIKPRDLIKSTCGNPARHEL